MVLARRRLLGWNVRFIRTSFKLLFTVRVEYTRFTLFFQAQLALYSQPCLHKTKSTKDVEDN